MLPPPELLPESAPRLSSDRYVLLAKVGKGGMAGVYAAWDVREQDWRAVKMLLPRFAKDKGIRTRFQNEGVTMAQMTHPNLVRVYEIGAAQSQNNSSLPFIVMELLNGGSLHRWVKTYGKMPPRLAVGAAIQLLQGLEVVHASNVVHRDVKPKNVLSDDASVLKLTDFGIAQLEASNETKTGLAMGTLGYMAPEQLHDAKSVDARSDLYGVAATLWTLLTTQKPRDLFRLEDRPDLMSEVPEPLRPILVRCLAYERADRPESARAVADELRNVLFSLPEDPPGTPDLSLHLGMPDIRNIPSDVFTELSLTGTGGAFQGGTSGSGTESSFGGKIGAPILPSGGGRAKWTPPPAPTPAPVSGRRLGARSLDPEPSPLVRDLQQAARLGAAEVEQPSGPPPASYADFRRESDARDEIPSYVVDVEPRPDPLPPPPLKEGPRAMGIVLRLVTLAGAGLLGLTFVAGLGIAGYAANGALGVRSAEESFQVAADELDRQVSYLDTLPTEVGALGGDRDGLQAAWDGWNRAEPGPERALLAAAFLRRAEAVAAPLILPTGGGRTHEQELVFQRLDRAEPSRRDAQAALDAWRASVDHPAAQLAVTLRLAHPPPGEPE